MVWWGCGVEGMWGVGVVWCSGGVGSRCGVVVWC